MRQILRVSCQAGIIGGVTSPADLVLPFPLCWLSPLFTTRCVNVLASRSDASASPHTCTTEPSVCGRSAKWMAEGMISLKLLLITEHAYWTLWRAESTQHVELFPGAVFPRSLSTVTFRLSLHFWHHPSSPSQQRLCSDWWDCSSSLGQWRNSVNSFHHLRSLPGCCRNFHQRFHTVPSWLSSGLSPLGHINSKVRKICGLGFCFADFRNTLLFWSEWSIHSAVSARINLSSLKTPHRWYQQLSNACVQMS